jgi:hypothetical protein
MSNSSHSPPTPPSGPPARVRVPLRSLLQPCGGGPTRGQDGAGHHHAERADDLLRGSARALGGVRARPGDELRTRPPSESSLPGARLHRRDPAGRGAWAGRLRCCRLDPYPVPRAAVHHRTHLPDRRGARRLPPERWCQAAAGSRRQAAPRGGRYQPRGAVDATARDAAGSELDHESGA